MDLDLQYMLSEQNMEVVRFAVPRDPIILSEDDWGVQSPPKRIVFRFHYHSQKVIGSLGSVSSI